MGALWVIVGLVVFLGLVFVIMYNSLIGRRNRVDQAFSSIDVMLKKRHDLIPNLVATVQQYASHERDLLQSITELRTRATSGSVAPAERVGIENQLTQALGRLIAVSENYPDLKANQNFLHLQGSLNEIEEQISASRRAYNASVTDLNNAVQMFPTSMIAGMAGVSTRPWFEAPEAERQNVDVGALFNRG